MRAEDIKYICDRLLSASRVLLIGHRNPDGDALGCTAALAVLLEKAGKQVKIIYPDKAAERLAFILDGREYETPESFDKSYMPDLTVALDSASPSRLGRFEYLAPDVDISIDHHDVCTPFAKETFTDGKASATSEIIYFIAKELICRGVIDGLSPDITSPMYAGIASDTGNFKYSNTTPETLRICAELLDTGIDNAEISRLLFDTCSLDKLRAESIAVQNLEVFAGGLAAIVTVDRDTLDGNKLTKDDFDDSVNIARKVIGVEVGAYIRPSDEDGKYKISLRANSYADVADIAALHAGGGHVRAAGCTVEASSIEAARDIIKKDIENALK